MEDDNPRGITGHDIYNNYPAGHSESGYQKYLLPPQSGTRELLVKTYRHKGLAITAMVLSFVGTVLSAAGVIGVFVSLGANSDSGIDHGYVSFSFGVVSSVSAIIIGILGVCQKQPPGMSITGIVLGALCLIAESPLLGAIFFG